ncbi:hypothetical protein AEYBE204_11815 [Asticcacaulis sp. YBE204]|nr:hypothetical protein AEYBE204_11815 [Asticcacaulis sp. YBE204]
MLLVRWALYYSEPALGLKVVNQDDFTTLLNDAYRLSNNGLKLEGQLDENVAPIFIRRLYGFQMPYQVQTYRLRGSSGRQLILFQEMGAAYGMDEIFIKFSGLTLKEYFDIYHACLTAVLVGDSQRISIAYFGPQFARDKLESFFSLLSLDLDQAKRFIRDNTHPKSDIEFQVNEHTPLERRPFFRSGHRFIPYCGQLLKCAFMNNVYDLFREKDDEFAGDRFGPVFEAYVDRGLVYAKHGDLLRGPQVQALLPLGSKGPDFLLRHEKDAVFIEAKCTELHPIARVIQSRQTILRNTRDTILKAVIQIMTAAAHLRASGEIADDVEVYGIVVTYRDHLIGGGEEFWDNVCGDYVTQALKEVGLEPSVKPAYILYLSIDDFDWLMAAVRETRMSIASIIRSIADADADFSSRCLVAETHFTKIFGKYYQPDYVIKASEDCFDGLVQKLVKSGR